MNVLDILISFAYVWTFSIPAFLVGFATGYFIVVNSTKFFFPKPSSRIEQSILCLILGQMALHLLVVLGLVMNLYILFIIPLIYFVNVPFAIGTILAGLWFGNGSWNFKINRLFIGTGIFFLLVIYSTFIDLGGEIAYESISSDSRIHTAIENKDILYADKLHEIDRNDFYSDYGLENNDYSVCNHLESYIAKTNCFTQDQTYSREAMTMGCKPHPDMEKSVADRVVSECLVTTEGLTQLADESLECSNLLGNFEDSSAIQTAMTGCGFFEKIQDSMIAGDVSMCDEFYSSKNNDTPKNLCISYHPESDAYLQQCAEALQRKNSVSGKEILERYRCPGYIGGDDHRLVMLGIFVRQGNNISYGRTILR